MENQILCAYVWKTEWYVVRITNILRLTCTQNKPTNLPHGAGMLATSLPHFCIFF